MDTGKTTLTTAKESELRSRRISDLALKIQGTRLETLVDKLYSELERSGISFRPTTYLSDEWGCPQNIPAIGIPFYLADPELCKMEGQFTGVEAEDEKEVMMLLRHEAGHALNYAYRFFAKRGWSKTFGQFKIPYREIYRASPFSARFVRHVPGWYAQKHPDEDFAETFAVWLTPGLPWREIYRDTPALQKLIFVNNLIHRYGRQSPEVILTRLDKPVQELNMTLDNWYQSFREVRPLQVRLPDIINEDLRRLLPAENGKPAADVIRASQSQLIQDVNYWTGIDRHILISLIDELLERVRTSGLKVSPQQESRLLANITAFITTLAMNYQCRGQFIEV
jgi:hypothetical protein